MNKQDKVGAKINLVKLPSNNPILFELDTETDWVKEFLLEMNENASEKSPEAYLDETSLFISGEIEKKTKNDMGEFLIVKGTIEADYVTECVRTLKPMTVQLDVPFKVVFIDEALATSELFAEIDETYIENDVYEIYFYNKRTVDFQEMLHEQIFLHYDQYPVLDADSKLDGVDSEGAQ
ncbi:MAG: YceD family protein [Bacteriovoracia bacterium]